MPNENVPSDLFGPNTETAGGTRYNVGKPQYHSLPILGLEEVARVGTQGAEKYGHFNWWKGQSFSTLVNSAMRHMLKVVWRPNSRDVESGNLHAAHVVWNLLAILHFIAESRDTELNDIASDRGEPRPVAISLAEAEARVFNEFSEETIVRAIDADDERFVQDAIDRAGGLGVTPEYALSARRVRLGHKILFGRAP